MGKLDSTLLGDNLRETNQNLKMVGKEENYDPENSHAELVKFTKRYSHVGRQKIAEEIRELRFQYFKKEKGNPERQETIAEQEKNIEELQKEKEQIEAEIKELEDQIEQQKARLWHRVLSMFRKNEIEQELQIDFKRKKLEDLKRDIEDRLKIIGEMESVILDTSHLQSAKDMLSAFYKEQSDLKSTFESEEKSRDAQTLSRENGYIFLHGIPTKNRGMNNTAENNPALKTGSMNTEDKLSLVMGLEPTISASVLKEGQPDAQTYYTFGVILGGGKILSAYKEDSGTLAESLYSRRSKYDRETQNTSIQSDIDKKLDEAVNAPVESRKWGKYNEIVVEQPKVAGLYINLSQLNKDYDRITIAELQKYSTSVNLPIYALKDGRMYPFGVDGKIGTREDGKRYQKENAFDVDGEQLSIRAVIDKQREVSLEEKLKLATSVIEKNPFRIDGKQDYEYYDAYMRGTFNSYTGREGYKKLQRAQEFHRQRIAVGLEDSDPGTSESVLKDSEERLKDLVEGKENATSNKAKTYFDRDIKQGLFSLYGFALDAKECGDDKTFEIAKDLINKFGSFDDCADLITKRVDERGEFMALDTDVPIEIRHKISELREQSI